MGAEMLQVLDRAEPVSYGRVVEVKSRGFDRPNRDQLMRTLSLFQSDPFSGYGMQALCEYAGASYYLLARYDLSSETGLDTVVSSNWPFDLVRSVSNELFAVHGRTTELEKCLASFHPAFTVFSDDAILPEGISRQYCSMMFNVGRSRLCLMLLFREDIILSHELLREVGLLTGYFTGSSRDHEARNVREFELTERELECLYWIAEGKTSDEIGTILGISKNTINNYITSVMRKTATKNRSETIAFAVRNNLV